MLARLMPREGRFFDLFNAHAERIIEGSRELAAMIGSFSELAITGAIVGVGTAQNVSAVRWGIAGTIVWAWILTIPCSAFIAGLAWWLGRHLFG